MFQTEFDLQAGEEGNGMDPIAAQNVRQFSGRLLDIMLIHKANHSIFRSRRKAADRCPAFTERAT